MVLLQQQEKLLGKDTCWGAGFVRLSEPDQRKWEAMGQVPAACTGRNVYRCKGGNIKWQLRNEPTFEEFLPKPAMKLTQPSYNKPFSVFLAFLLQDRKSNVMTCANNCRGVEPNPVIIMGRSVLLAATTDKCVHYMV